MNNTTAANRAWDQQQVFEALTNVPQFPYDIAKLTGYLTGAEVEVICEVLVGKGRALRQPGFAYIRN